MGHPRASERLRTQDPAIDLPRIYLLRGSVNSLVMPLSTRLPLLVATKIILLLDVPMRTKLHTVRAAAEQGERLYALKRRSCL
jgi:hypothetical protein